MLTCDCEILHGLHCLVCEIDYRILYGLLGLLCEKCDSFSLFLFDKVFINLGTCSAITRLLRQLPICLVCMPMRISHLSFDCIVSEIFFFYYGASVFSAMAHRFHIRGLNILMASIHGDGIGLHFFLLLCTKCPGQEFLDSQMWVYFFHICGIVCFL